ncbi:MAG: ABC transporter substrate-binding protein [Aeromicrobium sp.]|uniref:ABC transporter substrate-binding protein n=1 Tax=Aeromicrobium sp. TaxID=1871063 RepID=UPI0039E6963A
MRKHILKAVILAVLSATLLVAGCSGGGSNNGPKHVDAALYWFGTNLDPAVEYNGWTVRRAGIGENLVTIDENLEIVGEIADSWEMVDDTTWRFHIRPEVTFHNGDPVDAEAVKASFERVLGLAERARTSTGISNITVDGEDVVFSTDGPQASFLNAISEPLFTVVAVGEGIDYENAPIASGPFKVTSFEPDEKIELERYDDYWNGASDLDTITVVNIEEDSTRAAALQSGDVDVVQRIAAGDLDTFSGDDEYELTKTRGIRSRALQFNYDNPYLADANVRRAIAESLDYEALAEVLGDDAEVAAAPFPLEVYGYGEVPAYEFDKDAAADHLAEAGFSDSDADGYVDKDGQNLHLELTYDLADMTAFNEAIQDMLKQSGIELELNLVENLDDVEATGDFDIKERNTQYLSTGDPGWLLTSLYHSGSETNYGHYNDPEFDAMVDAISQEFDQAAKAKLVGEAQTYMLENAVDIYTVSQANVVASSSEVSNVLAHPIDYYFITNELTIND